jgi:aminopeptidase N
MMPTLLEAMRSVLRHPTLDAAFKELVLTLPSETYIAEQLDVVDPQRIHAVREAMRLQLAHGLQRTGNGPLLPTKDSGAYRPDPHLQGERALAGMALGILCLAATQTGRHRMARQGPPAFQGRRQYDRPLQRLAGTGGSGHALAKPALARFHALFKDEALVLDKWFALQAGAPDRGGEVLPAVRQLMRIPTSTSATPTGRVA